jgi:hypothetical protein
VKFKEAAANRFAALHGHWQRAVFRRLAACMDAGASERDPPPREVIVSRPKETNLKAEIPAGYRDGLVSTGTVFGICR